MVLLRKKEVRREPPNERRDHEQEDDQARDVHRCYRNCCGCECPRNPCCGGGFEARAGVAQQEVRRWQGQRQARCRGSCQHGQGCDCPV